VDPNTDPENIKILTPKSFTTRKPLNHTGPGTLIETKTTYRGKTTGGANIHSLMF
jgi:hypothetical protein